MNKKPLSGRHSSPHWFVVSASLMSALAALGQTASNNVEARVEDILSRMTLDQKLSYIDGTPFFDVKPIPVSGLGVLMNPHISQSDAGLGVRRNSPSVRYPSGLALASTWNADRARDQGTALGRDTRARGYFSILAPGMNLYRTPLGGRNFEYIAGEDPYLGGRLAVPMIQAIQAQGVWACAKHFVCNDQEENRTDINIQVDERTLREIYLPPFEAAVKDGHVATVMGAYNAVNGSFCCENAFLNTQVLKQEWGFSGLFMSDYDAIHNGLTAALAGCDLDLPAGNFMNPQALLPAIQSGQLALAKIDDKVRRILRAVVSFGFLDRQQLDASIPLDDPNSKLASLDVAREGIVLLKNAGELLPLERTMVHSIAVMGPAAQGAPPTGFGSSYLTPISYVSELDGIKSRVAAGTKVDLISACTLDPQNTLLESVDSHGAIVQGLQAAYFASNDLSGTPVLTRVDPRVNFDWDTDPVPVSTNQGGFSARWTGQIRPQISGDHVFKVRGDGGLRLSVNGQALIDNFWSPTLPAVGYGPTVALYAKIALQAGQVCTIELDYRRVGGFYATFEHGGLTGVQLSWASLQAPPEIATYDAVVMCQGISNEYEGEGHDRPFQLPEFQDELIQNLSRANPRTIVVLHGGGNFDSTQWLDQVAGLLHAWYPGQNGGQALGEILFGDVNPSGKLPVTFEKHITDNPAYMTVPTPLNQHPTTMSCSEGIYVGYRGYERNGTQPQFPFGFGLSYTTFAYSDLGITPDTLASNGVVNVTFTVTNTGTRPGAEAAQLYVGQENPSVDRPRKELKGFQKVFLQPGESKMVNLTLDGRSLAYFNAPAHAWDAEQGVYDVLIGASSQDIRLSGKLVNPSTTLIPITN